MKVVILCGGKGTRSYPFTDYFPKVMMPIGGTPILVHLLRIFEEQGFHEFVVAAGHRKEALSDYFDGKHERHNVTIVDTGADSDTGERIRRCADYVGDRFLATYGDGLGNIDLDALIQRHEQHGGLATVTAVPLRSTYGTVDFDEHGRVERFLEKPVIEDRWINGGFFVFERTVFDHWEGQNLENEILPALARRGELYAYRHSGFWKSMDTSKDLQEFENIYLRGGRPWMPSRSAMAVSA